jgi:hypothetical protein
MKPVAPPSPPSYAQEVERQGGKLRVAKGVMVGVVVVAAFATIFVVGGGSGAHAVAAGHSATDSAELPVTVGQLAQLPIIAGFVAATWFCLRALSSGRKLQ